MSDVPDAPNGLGDRAAAFWDATVADFELSRAELELLTEICRMIDRCELLEARVAADGVMVPGSMGQDRLHPAITELRGTELALSRLLSQLELPDEDGNAVPTPRQVSASRAGAISRPPDNVTRLAGRGA